MAWRVGLAATFTVLFAALYWWVVGTIEGKHLDSATVVAVLPDVEHRSAAITVADLTGVWTVAPIGLALVAVAWWRGGRCCAAAVAIMLVAVTACARLLKALLERLDPLGEEATRLLGAGYFPSGHAAAAMALALAAVLLAPAGRARLAVVVVGAIAVATVSLANLAAEFHHPSDLVAGHLLAGLGATALAGSITRRRRLRPPSAPRIRVSAAGRRVLPLVVAVGVVVATGAAAAAAVFGGRVLDTAGEAGVAVAVAPLVVAAMVGAVAPRPRGAAEA